MATKQALKTLQNLMALQEEADRKIVGLATTLTKANDQIDAVLQDADREVAETVTESYSPGEALMLAQEPVQDGSVKIYLDGSLVSSDLYEVDYATGEITPNQQLNAGVEITANYTVMGLASQVAKLLAVMPGVSAQAILDKKDSYEVAIAWIRDNYGA